MYLYDKDLEFIRFCSNEDLDVLHDYILKDRHGNFRLREMLTVKDLYKHEKSKIEVIEENFLIKYL
ncbi:DUF3944 domain-containing protein [Clostridium perfringens]|nr:DUF3944 domain-containing protein [Clostridium perfringens]